MPPSLRFTLAFPDPASHLIEVTLEARDVPAVDGVVDLTMPAWTPGSYLVRDYARHVQDFEAADAQGKALPWRRADKATFRVTVKDRSRFVVTYRVYANDLTVRSSHVDDTHAYMDGTSVFLAPLDAEAASTVVVKPPRGWHVDSGLPAVAGKTNTFAAEDREHLYDATFEVGTHRTFDFKVKSKQHRLALYGHGNEDADQFVQDLAAIVREEVAMMGTQPYGDYLFILHLLDQGGGGLEHRDSNTSSVSRFSFQPRKKYENVLALEAHEFFHVWNVKRIKPAAFVPYDYAAENYTSLLWAMEGITSYYDHLVLARTGLMAENRYRDFLAESISHLRGAPGSAVMSLEDSSRLTWVKLYKRDENWVNTGVSYYLKGELVALVLDLAIRDRSNGRKSLDDVMREVYARYGPGSAGIAEEPKNQWRETLEDVTGLKWAPFWRRYIAGAGDVDFERYLRQVGWRLTPHYAHTDDKTAHEKGEYTGPGAWLGAAFDKKETRLVVKHVLTASPAAEAGLAAGDELVAWDGLRVADDQFVKDRLREQAAGADVGLTFFRRDELVDVSATLAAPPPDKWTLAEDDRVTAAQKRRRAAWLKPYTRKLRS